MPVEQRRRVAIVLFNLGGPDRPEAIGPFLRNLFTDSAILRVPFFIRPILARIIARARVQPATANYALLGGKSPLLDLTKAQADALEVALPELMAKCFIAMRYWHPFARETVREVQSWDPDEIVLLPLYPQFSTTTTGSSLTNWRETAVKAGLIADVTTLCCYPDEAAFVRTTAARLRDTIDRARREIPAGTRLRVLFSAHGLPEVIVRCGDPYQWQIERSVASVVKEMADPGLDWTICYQSRATPQKWLEPSTEQEIERAARDAVAVVVTPIAFVSEHVETLVELDVEYRDLAEKRGLPGYFRVPAANADAGFIEALAGMVRQARARRPGLCSYLGSRICPAGYGGCPVARQPSA